jgi:hypothetical protein
MLMELPCDAKQRVDRDPPNLMKCRVEIDEPMCTCFRRDVAPANVLGEAAPPTEQPEDKRAKFRNESDEPMTTKSMTERLPAILPKALIENEEPAERIPITEAV